MHLFLSIIRISLVKYKINSLDWRSKLSLVYSALLTGCLISLDSLGYLPTYSNSFLYINIHVISCFSGIYLQVILVGKSDMLCLSESSVFAQREVEMMSRQDNFWVWTELERYPAWAIKSIILHLSLAQSKLPSRAGMRFMGIFS